MAKQKKHIQEGAPTKVSASCAPIGNNVGKASKNSQSGQNKFKKSMNSLSSIEQKVTQNQLSSLASPAATRKVLEQFGLYSKKKFGQNFLVSNTVLQRIMKLAQLDSHSVVLEVGPGIGTLSRELLQQCAALIAVEYDSDIVPALMHSIKPWEDKFFLINKDALHLHYDDFPSKSCKSRMQCEHEQVVSNSCNTSLQPGNTSNVANCAELHSGHNSLISQIEQGQENARQHPTADQECCTNQTVQETTSNNYVGAHADQVSHKSQIEQDKLLPCSLVSNLPYSVAATVVLDYFQRFSSLQSATVMVQKEVAARMAAKPCNKNYGAYTVKLSMFASVGKSFAVDRSKFYPQPHVDSTVIRLDRRKAVDSRGESLSAEEIQHVCLMADAAFASRRKTIANSFRAYFSSCGHKASKIVLQRMDDLFELAGIDPKRRGETLTQQEFIALAKAFSLLFR